MNYYHLNSLLNMIYIMFKSVNLAQICIKRNNGKCGRSIQKNWRDYQLSE